MSTIDCNYSKIKAKSTSAARLEGACSAKRSNIVGALRTPLERSKARKIEIRHSTYLQPLSKTLFTTPARTVTVCMPP